MRGAQRGRGHDFAVEPAREGTREHVGGVVGAPVEVARDHRFDQHRVGERAVGREPDHVVGGMRVERVHEPVEHVGLGAAHDLAARVERDVDHRVVAVERARRDHEVVDAQVGEPVEHEAQERAAAEVLASTLPGRRVEPVRAWITQRVERARVIGRSSLARRGARACRRRGSRRRR